MVDLDEIPPGRFRVIQLATGERLDLADPTLGRPDGLRLWDRAAAQVSHRHAPTARCLFPQCEGAPVILKTYRATGTRYASHFRGEGGRGATPSPRRTVPVTARCSMSGPRSTTTTDGSTRRTEVRAAGAISARPAPIDQPAAMIRVTAPDRSCSRHRGASLALRTALEIAIDQKLDSELPGLSDTRSMRAKLLCLRHYAEPRTATRVSAVWSHVCLGCHCHQYEMGPTRAQVQTWRSEVDDLVGHLVLDLKQVGARPEFELLKPVHPMSRESTGAHRGSTGELARDVPPADLGKRETLGELALR